MATTSNKTVGQRLREARKEKGLTQQELAEEAEVLITNISHWERDKNEPSLYNIWKICEVLEVSIDWIAEGCAYR